MTDVPGPLLRMIPGMVGGAEGTAATTHKPAELGLPEHRQALS